VERNPIGTAKLRRPGGIVLAVIFLTTTTLVSWLPSSSRAAPASQTFTAVGNEEYFTVPSGVTRLTVDMVAGSDSFCCGLGGRVFADISVTPGEVLKVLVGLPGDRFTGQGGWPDGGNGGGARYNANASGGGGSTSIRNYSNDSIILIAGAGGGGTNYSRAGEGGFPWGQDASQGSIGKEYMHGRGATQFEGGSGGCELDRTCYSLANGVFNQGGHANLGGGGGGGYYGGGAGGGGVVGDYYELGAGGGGSSWSDPARVYPGTSVTFRPGWYEPDPYFGPGYVTLAWTSVDATTTTAPTTTTPATTNAPSTTVASTTSVATTTTVASTTTSPAPTSTVMTTTTQPMATSTPPPPSTSVVPSAPSWTSTPEVESEVSVTGATPFPASGAGTVEVTDETGFVITKARAFIPKWRTRVYIGDFKFSLKATYVEKKKKKTFSCVIPTFGTQKLQKTSFSWRWYQPSKGCVLPKELVTQLAKRTTSMTLSGSFTRKWATSGKGTRPDGSKITSRKISLRIGAADTVTLS
jgi:hypothetical protein